MKQEREKQLHEAQKLDSLLLTEQTAAEDLKERKVRCPVCSHLSAFLYLIVLHSLLTQATELLYAST